ncbi:hypothetical protein NEOLI_000270 [Neolecta irregularis DAH-3]|uniref:Uncharacterized protein n=1 Tax=Neolecta irregularis (strain DAH-3) TaxID=1198029 RepID=A0A1U7LV96_NEOID|nr:hypothetical protein NEOLI_000270 [Neolecta irregularis DAH-3]|eukprot:OLL26549.1 hypothetical protein NEOLI_000270 [Neolecta irregularis DAH-3]
MSTRNPFNKISRRITKSKSKSKDDLGPDDIAIPDKSKKMRNRRSLFTIFTKPELVKSFKSRTHSLESGGDTERDWEKRATILAHSPGPSVLPKLNRSEVISDNAFMQEDLENLKRLGEEEEEDKYLSIEQLMNRAICFHEHGG